MSVAVAMLLNTALDPALTQEALTRQFAADWPADAQSLAPWEGDDYPLPDHAHSDDPIFFSVGEFQVAFLPIACPMGDDVAQLCLSSRLWPEHAPFCHNYQAHTIVAVFNPQADPMDVTVMLSQVVASAIAVSQNVFSLYWAGANHLVLPAAFRDLATAILPDPLIHAWVALNVGEDPETGVLTAHTVGLDALGLMDVEIPRSTKSPRETFEFLEGIAVYLLGNGLVIKDGDTVGESAREKIQAIYTQSLVDPDKLVMQLVMEEKKKKGLFGLFRS